MCKNHLCSRVPISEQIEPTVVVSNKSWRRSRGSIGQDEEVIKLANLWIVESLYFVIYFINLTNFLFFY